MIAMRQPGADGSAQRYRPKHAPRANGFSVQNGPLTFRQALRESLNLPALSVARAVGVDAIMETVSLFGIRRDWGDRSNYGVSFAIGAGELRLIDMASAFQVIANMGVRVEPTFIHHVVDRNGKTVRDFAPKPEGRRARLRDGGHPQGRHRRRAELGLRQLDDDRPAGGPEDGHDRRL
ncbi:MAG: hypothetical protein FJ028_10305 [Chloroflexi bacterium]|nr:hypothetical protein [Chloroflexota bacterium]